MAAHRFRAARRRRAARRLGDGPLRRYLQAPPPSPRTPLDELPLLAVDVETTGLDPAVDQLLSIGFVPVDGERIVLGGAGSLLLRPPGDDGRGVGQSAVLHGITDDAVASGLDAGEALDRVLDALTGRVLVGHYARMEVGFLSQLCARVHGRRPPLTVVDTLELHQRVLAPGFDAGFAPGPAPGELRLWSARERYGLPRYRAHDALADAVACAELYLAQTAELRERGAAVLRDLG
ncbi:MAG TPA: DNA polymerase III subunit epsilon [Candidatus Dietzia intestinipullorum]|nr:DNA polymerase III subunit epsilon [Candidatus Dietzia intestinipullorum]